MKHENLMTYQDHLMNYELATPAYRTSADKTSHYARYGKRVFDVALCIFLAPVLVPVIAILAAITLLDGGSPFFGHKRVGKDGKEFRCWKIRTMVPDAEARLNDYLAANPKAAAEWKRDFKLENDPRITRIGGFLRKTSLDELPQLLNVFLNEMSFVGPRPIVRAELAKYGASSAMYLRMKPGVTGLWQVSGRNDVEYSERVALDARYARRMRLGLDARIIAMTAGSVLGMTGK